MTVTDPGAGGREVDVLAVGPAPPRGLGPSTRRRLRIVTVLVVVVAAVAAAVVAREQAEDAERRREARVVDLTVLPGNQVTSRLDGAVATLRLVLKVRNDGPLPVRVLSGGIGGYGVGREVVLEPGATSSLQLERFVRCQFDEPPDALASDTLRLSIDTGLGARSVELPLPLLLRDDAAQRACGFRAPL